MTGRPRPGKAIRAMHPTDTATVLRLWRTTDGISTSDREALVRRFLRRNHGGSFVAHEGRRLVGAVLGGHDGRRGMLWHLAVARSARRRGLGKALVSRALRWQRAQGIRKVNILVLRANRRALAFWRRTGWETGPILVLSRRLRA